MSSLKTISLSMYDWCFKVKKLTQGQGLEEDSNRASRIKRHTQLMNNACTLSARISDMHCTQSLLVSM